MGCDIHFFAEYRTAADQPWRFLPAPPTGHDWQKVKDLGDAYAGGPPYRYGELDPSTTGYRPGYETEYDDCLRDWFDDRNYWLFAMLADVRNDGSVEPILPAPHTRGWPDDCCPELEAERVLIEHTPSWLTVREMMDYFERRRLAVLARYTERFEACLREMVSVAGVDPENIRAVFYFDS